MSSYWSQLRGNQLFSCLVVTSSFSGPWLYTRLRAVIIRVTDHRPASFWLPQILICWSQNIQLTNVLHPTLVTGHQFWKFLQTEKWHKVEAEGEGSPDPVTLWAVSFWTGRIWMHCLCIHEGTGTDDDAERAKPCGTWAKPCGCFQKQASSEVFTCHLKVWVDFAETFQGVPGGKPCGPTK